MERDWPARDVATMVHADRRSRHAVTPEGMTKLSAEAGQGDPRSAPATAQPRSGAMRSSPNSNKLAVEIADYLDILRSRARIQTIHQG